MTTPVSGNSSVAGVLAASNAAASAASSVNSASSTPTAATDAVDKDTFLKLMVAQLKYQNPDSPVDSSQYLAQTAAFTQVEKLDDLSTKLDSLVQDQLQATATGLLGRTVQLTVGGRTESGVVSGISTAQGGATPEVGDQKVALADVGQVTATAIPAS